MRVIAVLVAFMAAPAFAQTVPAQTTPAPAQPAAAPQPAATPPATPPAAPAAQSTPAAPAVQPAPVTGKVKPSLATIEQKPDWRSQGIPVWIWPIVGVLGLVWIKFLLPEEWFRKKVAAPRKEPVTFVEPRVAPIAAAPAVVAPAPAHAPPVASVAPASRPSAQNVAWSLDLINGLSLSRLEPLVQRFWQARGCQVERARGTDGSIDLLVSRPATGKLFALAHCASTTGEKIALAPVQALAAVGQQKAAGLVVLYALTGFTDEALAFAKDKPVKLINADGLLAEIRLLPPAQQQLLLERTLIDSGPAVARA